MAERGRPKAELVVTAQERAVLERWARRGTSAQALAVRSRIVLACADGTANKDAAARLGVTPQMVGKWRGRFVAGGLDGLADEPRPGQPRKITDERVEAVIVKTLEDRPPGQDTHWSTRSMAKATGLNQTAVSRIWRAFGLKPHVQQTWKLSSDPQFIEQVRDSSGCT
jgi:transposase